MSASVKRKYKASKRVQSDLATTMFKKGTFTSQWTEDDAVNYFNMRKTGESVLRTGRADTTPVEWYLDEDRVVNKRELTA